jgi:hypothetical protein
MVGSWWFAVTADGALVRGTGEGATGGDQSRGGHGYP